MGSSRVLVADIDGTLLGDVDALERFAAWHAAHRARYRLVYATGRLRASLSEVIAESALPEPDVVISAVGTEIHDGRGRPWPGWAEQFHGWDANAVRRRLREFMWLELQPEEAQTRLKASYDVLGLSASDRTTIRRALARGGLDASIVYNSGLHLDVLPSAAGKGNAARFVVDSWGVASDDVMVFGDSGNDLDLFQRGFRGTLVANALPELSVAVGDDAYRSPLAYAAGVLDGIRHWSGPDWLDIQR
jgi:sucrose-6F-phosphate phosphohydrolase